jgi:hypothetical protein
MREADKLASDLAWRGFKEEADIAQKKADEYRERIANGELYEVDF